MRARSLVTDGLSSREAEWTVGQERTLAELGLERSVPMIATPLSDLSQV